MIDQILVAQRRKEKKKGARVVSPADEMRMTRDVS